MMLWLGVALVAAGVPLLFVDRRIARYCRANVQGRVLALMVRTTDWAKGIVWIIAVALFYLGGQIWMEIAGENPAARRISDVSLALLASLIAGSIVLHTAKLFLGRRRPRDDFEHGLYGFVFFTWSLQYNSFPSGHALTIFTLATWATALMPVMAPLWFALAVYLSATRACLAVHFLSDVAIGAGIGIIATRLTMTLFFPQLTPAWF
jgi:membrane-associated phospholipid phosphatase